MPEISWTESKHALSYEIRLRRLDDQWDYIRKQTIYTSLIVETGYLEQQFTRDSTVKVIDFKVIVFITAKDSSYVPYYSDYDGQHPLTPELEIIANQLGLEPGQNDNILGGKGFFTSYYTVSDTIGVRFRKENLP